MLFLALLVHPDKVKVKILRRYSFKFCKMYYFVWKLTTIKRASCENPHGNWDIDTTTVLLYYNKRESVNTLVTNRPNLVVSCLYMFTSFLFLILSKLNVLYLQNYCILEQTALPETTGTTHMPYTTSTTSPTTGMWTD